MARRAAPRCAVQPLESGLGEMRAAVRPERQRETRLRALLEEIDEAFVAVDWEYRCVHANGAALQLVGQSLEEMLGRRPWELFSQPAGTALERAYRDAMELGKPQHDRAPLGDERRLARGPDVPHPRRGERLLPPDRRTQTHRGGSRAPARGLRARALAQHAAAATSRAPPRARSASRRSASAFSSRSTLTPTCGRPPSTSPTGEPARCAAWRCSAIPTPRRPSCASCRSRDESACGRLLVHGLPELTGEHDGALRRGVSARDPASAGRLALPISHQGETLGAMTLLLRGARRPRNRRTSSSTAAWPRSSAARWPTPAATRPRSRHRRALRRYELLADEARDAMLFVRRRDGRIPRGQRPPPWRCTASPESARPLVHDLRATGTRDRGPAPRWRAASQRRVRLETRHHRRDGSTLRRRGARAVRPPRRRRRAAEHRPRRPRSCRPNRRCATAKTATAPWSTETAIAILVHAEGPACSPTRRPQLCSAPRTPDELVGSRSSKPSTRRARASHRTASSRPAGPDHAPARRLWLRRDGRVVDTEVTGAGVDSTASRRASVMVRDIRRPTSARRSRTAAELGFSNTLLRAAETLSSSMQIDTVLDRLAELLVEAVERRPAGGAAVGSTPRARSPWPCRKAASRSRSATAWSATTRHRRRARCEPAA